VPKRFLRLTSTALSLVIFCTNCVLVHAQEANIWAERRQFSQPAISLLPAPAPLFPESPRLLLDPNGSASLGFQESSDPSAALAFLAPYGSIRKILQPRNQADAAAVVIHIQDVHLNPEAQRNIGGALRSLMIHSKLDTLALEGAFAPIDLIPYQRYPHRHTVQMVLDYLLRTNRISGAIYAMASASPSDAPQVMGIDDRRHYLANIQAYRAAVLAQKGVKKEVALLHRRLSDEKAHSLNADLRRLDGLAEQYAERTISIGDYLTELQALRSKSRQPIIPTPQLNVFLRAFQMESSLNFARVETERTMLLAQLAKKITRLQADSLLTLSRRYRDGEISHSHFYSQLKNLCQANGVTLNQFPAMNAYLKYVISAERIDSESLLREKSALEEDTYRSLAKSPQEKNLVAESLFLRLIGKLADFSLTKEEWDDYKKGRSRISRLKLPEPRELQPFESFYEEAENRDRSMASRFLQEAGPSRIRRLLVVVTGGFHASGVDEKLTAAGYKVVRFTPRITRVDTENGPSYLNFFTQEKAPLDKLFEGEKLFLSPPPAGGLSGGAILGSALESGTADQTLHALDPNTSAHAQDASTTASPHAIHLAGPEQIARDVTVTARQGAIADVAITAEKFQRLKDLLGQFAAVMRQARDQARRESHAELIATLEVLEGVVTSVYSLWGKMAHISWSPLSHFFSNNMGASLVETWLYLLGHGAPEQTAGIRAQIANNEFPEFIEAFLRMISFRDGILHGPSETVASSSQIVVPAGQVPSILDWYRSSAGDLMWILPPGISVPDAEAAIRIQFAIRELVRNATDAVGIENVQVVFELLHGSDYALAVRVVNPGPIGLDAMYQALPRLLEILHDIQATIAAGSARKYAIEHQAALADTIALVNRTLAEGPEAFSFERARELMTSAFFSTKTEKLRNYYVLHMGEDGGRYESWTRDSQTTAGLGLYLADRELREKGMDLQFETLLEDNRIQTRVSVLIPAAPLKLDSTARERTFLQRIINFLALRDPLPERADLLLLLGNDDLKTFEEAARLYREGRVSHILVSGGRGSLTATLIKNARETGSPVSTDEESTISEAEIITRMLITQGVPSHAITLETKSTNTPQNIENSLPLIDSLRIDGGPVQSIIMLQTPLRQRRADATARKLIPVRYTVYNHTVNVPSTEGLEAPALAELAATVLPELAKLKTFADKGDISPTTIPENVRQAANAFDQEKTSFPSATPRSPFEKDFWLILSDRDDTLINIMRTIAAPVADAIDLVFAKSPDITLALVTTGHARGTFETIVRYLSDRVREKTYVFGGRGFHNAPVGYLPGGEHDENIFFTGEPSVANKLEYTLIMAHIVAEARGKDESEAMRHTLAFGDESSDVGMLNAIAQAGGTAVWLGGKPDTRLHPDVVIMRKQGPQGALLALRMHAAWLLRQDGGRPGRSASASGSLIASILFGLAGGAVWALGWNLGHLPALWLAGGLGALSAFFLIQAHIMFLLKPFVAFLARWGANRHNLQLISALRNMERSDDVAFLQVRGGTQFINRPLRRNLAKLSIPLQRFLYRAFIWPFRTIHERPAHFTFLSHLPRWLNEGIAYPLEVLAVLAFGAGFAYHGTLFGALLWGGTGLAIHIALMCSGAAWENFLARHGGEKIEGLGLFFGWVIAFLLAPVVAVIIVILAPFILFSSRGPLFFSQERLGINGKRFRVWKLRTMSEGRITWLGKLLRSVGIDESPQLWNILDGDMRWFGPRPHQPEQLNFEYIDKILSRTKPGLLGTHATKTRLGYKLHPFTRETYEEELRDLENRSVWNNIRIFFLFLVSAAQGFWLTLTHSITEGRGKPHPQGLVPYLNPFSWWYARNARRVQEGKFVRVQPGAIAFMGGFLEESLGRWAVITYVFPLFALSLTPAGAILLYAALFSTVMHPKLFTGEDSKSFWFWQIPFRKQLIARSTLFLLSVGVGAGGHLIPSFPAILPFLSPALLVTCTFPFLTFLAPSYWIMGLLHGTYNPIARRLGGPIALAGAKNHEGASVAAASAIEPALPASGLSQPHRLGANASEMDQVLENLRGRRPASLDIAHAVDGSSVTAFIVHVNSPKDAADLRALFEAPSIGKRKNVIVIVSSSMSVPVWALIGLYHRGNDTAVVNLRDLTLNKKTGFYSYDEVLQKPQTRRLEAVRLLAENKFANGRLIVISRELVLFNASAALANIISLLTYRQDGWVSYQLNDVLAGIRSTGRSA